MDDPATSLSRVQKYFHTADRKPRSSTTSTLIGSHSRCVRLVGRDVALHLLDLFDQVGLLIIELVVLGTVVVEARQKLYQFVTIANQDRLDGWRLVGVGYKYLKHK